MVLNTIIRCLETLGHELHVAYFAKGGASEPGGERSGATTYHRLPLPGAFQLLRNGGRLALDTSYTINEALYFSVAGRDRCAETIAAVGPELIVVDMLRCAQFVKSGDVPVILDLDDLLSRRYRELARGSFTAEMILGYYAERIPFLPLVGRVAQPFLATLIALESARLEHKEIDAVSRFDAVTLVSQREVEILRASCDARVTVTAIPMAIDVPARHAVLSDRPSRLVFVGSPSYWPNRQALIYADDVLFPHAERRLGAALTLTVVGTADQSQRSSFSPRMRFTGYVEDLDAVLTDHDIFIAPIVSGSGIKTKVIEAMSRGLVVVGSPRAFEGLAVKHLEHALVFETPDEFADGLDYLRSHVGDARRMAESAFRYVSETFTFEVISERWRSTVQALYPRSLTPSPEA